MNKEEFAKAWEEADRKVQAEVGEPLAGVLTSAVLSATLLTTAAVKGKRGNYPSAILFAILWHGFNSNRNATLLHKQQKIIARRGR